MLILLPLLYGLAMFVASNLVAIPVGVISGFREARKRPLSRRTASALDVVESTVEMAVLIAISVRLIRSQGDHSLAGVALAYGLLIVLEAISLRMLKLSTPAKWFRVLATMAVVAAISFAVA